MEDLFELIQINTVNFLREWQICMFAVQIALFLIGFTYYFKTGIGFLEVPERRASYYRLATFFLFFSLSLFLNIIGVFYSSSSQMKYTLITLAIGVGSIAIIRLIENLQKIRAIGTNRNLIIISMGITCLIFILSFAPDNIFTPIIALPIWFLTPVVFFYISIREKGNIRIESSLLGLGFLLFFGGLIVIPDIIDNILPDIRVFGEPFIFLFYNYISIGIVFIGIALIFYFGRINLSKQIKWEEKVNAIYIFLKNGEYIIHKELTPDKESPNISDIQNQINKILQDSKETDKSRRRIFENLISSGRYMKIIEKEDKTLFLKEGIYTNALLITKERLNIYEIKLRDFLREFELLYGEFLSNWSGNLDIFESSYGLVDRHFQEGGK